MCPLCSAKQTHCYYQDPRRTYLQCQTCQFVFVEPHFRPTKTQELKEYSLHQNHIDDAGYLRFLSRPLQAALSPFKTQSLTAKRALDFGCGSNPVLALMLSNTVSEVAYYDPLFFPHVELTNCHFDIVTCTEAIEHFHTPAREWERLTALLNENGVLVVMTKRVISAERFANWHYKNDPTHVSFFSEFTFRYLAEKSQLKVVFPSADIAVFRRNE